MIIGHLPPRLPVALFLIAAAVSSCAGHAVSSHTTVSVAIRNYAFTPSSITVAPGDTVVWTNRDTVPHTVSADGGSASHFDSGALKEGEAFRFTFTKSGVLHYHCAFHPFMRGIIRVRRS